LYLFFFKGMITGFILSLPFGPVGAYCMEKTLIEGQKKGYTAAMGMVTVDLIYNFAVLIFMESFDHIILKYEMFFTFLVGLFLLCIGINKLKTPVKLSHMQYDDTIGCAKGYFTVFAIALTNVSSFLTIGSIYTSIRMFANFNSRVIPFVLAGVLTGGGSLWFLTTYILSHWRKTINENNLIRIVKITGIIIISFGGMLMINATKKIVPFCIATY